jgi:hypothetical protein
VLLGGAAALVAALVGFSFLAYRHYSSERTSFTNLGYQVVSDRQVVVRFQVALGAGTKAQCLVQARDRDSLEVGSQLVTVVGRTGGAVTVAHPLSTSRRAVSGVVLSCRRGP